MSDIVETCHEDCGSDPCGAEAVGYRFDPEYPGEGPYPVCQKHVREPMAPDAALITLAVELGPEKLTALRDLTATHSADDLRAMVALVLELGGPERVRAGVELAEAHVAYDNYMDRDIRQPGVTDLGGKMDAALARFREVGTR